jgi:creatinine amidohydrolase/Fe(II)-dependent formamide hydrolase-like protein
MAATKKKCLSFLTFQEIEKELPRHPAIILPLGGCEPYGTSGALGAATACAEALAVALSKGRNILYAPPLAFGCSTAYGSFGGTTGVKPRTMANVLCETILRWYLQGFRNIIIIDSLYDNNGAVLAASRRLTSAHPGLDVLVFSLQRDERVRAFIARHSKEKEPGRNEYGLLSLAAHIDPALVRPAGQKVPGSPVDSKRFEAWRKRGADPQQFRKLFPESSVSNSACRFDPAFGKELFEFIVQVLVDTVNLHYKINF